LSCSFLFRSFVPGPCRQVPAFRFGQASFLQGIVLFPNSRTSFLFFSILTTVPPSGCSLLRSPSTPPPPPVFVFFALLPPFFSFSPPVGSGLAHQNLILSPLVFFPFSSMTFPSLRVFLRLVHYLSGSPTRSPPPDVPPPLQGNCESPLYDSSAPFDDPPFGRFLIFSSKPRDPRFWIASHATLAAPRLTPPAEAVSYRLTCETFFLQAPPLPPFFSSSSPPISPPRFMNDLMCCAFNPFHVSLPLFMPFLFENVFFGTLGFSRRIPFFRPF